MAVLTPGHALVPLGAPLTVSDPPQLGARAAAADTADTTPDSPAHGPADVARPVCRHADGEVGARAEAAEERATLEVVIREGHVSVRCKAQAAGAVDSAAAGGVAEVRPGAGGAGRVGGGSGSGCGAAEAGDSIAAARQLQGGVEGSEGAPGVARLLRHADGELQVCPPARTACLHCWSGRGCADLWAHMHRRSDARELPDR